MSEWIAPYAATVFAIGATGGLLLIQILVADFAGIRAGHMLCYCLDLRLVRSLSFGVSLLAPVGMLGVGIAAGLR